MADPHPHRHAMPPEHIDWTAGVLSYLIPGLGQLVRKRVAKGLLFFFSLNALFFYGMWLGQGANVYLPDTGERGQGSIARLGSDLYNRPHFAGQFWMGIAAWPAVYQYINYDPMEGSGPVFGTFQRQPRQAVINEMQRDADKEWDLGWVYTVIAGVLNLLVIYDAAAGPAFRITAKQLKEEKEGKATVAAEEEKTKEPIS